MHLLFDLDGTLTDSRQGVTRCIQHALAEMGVTSPPVEELTQFVGPPLSLCFSTLLETTDSRLVDRAITLYRRRFVRAGMFENVLFPGIADLLNECAIAGHVMCVVTVKPHVYARQILDHFGIASLIRRVYGPDLAARNYTKEQVIRDACVGEHLQGGHDVMIGDRAEDVLGARRNGLASVGVTWGYGGRAELEAAQPNCMVSSTSELLDYVRRIAAS